MQRKPRHDSMPAADFAAWRLRMGWSRRRTAAELHLNQETVARYETGRARGKAAPIIIPRTVALACAALEHGLVKTGAGAEHGQAS
jgi:transcriptional regulator with XRE-family HTH domain